MSMTFVTRGAYFCRLVCVAIAAGCLLAACNRAAVNEGAVSVAEGDASANARPIERSTEDNEQPDPDHFLDANGEQFEFEEEAPDLELPLEPWQIENDAPEPPKPKRLIGQRLDLGMRLDPPDDLADNDSEPWSYYRPALQWLAAQQQQDSSWRFDGKPAGQQEAARAGDNNNPNSPLAATAITLMAFQTVSQTHTEGSNKNTVKRGLVYLLQGAREEENRGAMSDAAMPVFSHALATQAVCQGYSMTGDRKLKVPSQWAIDYLLRLQDEAGRWQDERGAFDGLTLTAWSLATLREGHLAYLNVPPESVARANTFVESAKPKWLDADEANDADREAENSQDAAAWILSSAVLGKLGKRDGLHEYLDRLIERGPQRGEMQTNYFITYAIIGSRHYNGWGKWSKALREQLLADQVKEGDNAGSWYYEEGDPFNRRGGRLYCTAMALILLRHCDDHRHFRMAPVDEDAFPL